jgi:hypothetical protein
MISTLILGRSMRYAVGLAKGPTASCGRASTGRFPNSSIHLCDIRSIKFEIRLLMISLYIQVQQRSFPLVKQTSSRDVVLFFTEYV